MTVTVRWNEGPNPKEFTLVQYLTNPQQAGFTAGAIPSASSSNGTIMNQPPPGSVPGSPLMGGR